MSVVVRYQIFVAQRVWRLKKGRDEKKKTGPRGNFATLPVIDTAEFFDSMGNSCREKPTRRRALKCRSLELFFHAETRKKYTLNPISRRAVSDIHAKSYAYLFFMRNAAPDGDSTNDSAGFT